MTLAQSAVLLVLVAAPFGYAQDTSSPAGHWEGAVQLARKQVAVVVDVARNPQGEWTGSLGFPAQKLSDIRLSQITVKDGAVTMLSIESRILLEGKLSADGKAVEGSFLCGSLRTVPVSVRLKRTSDAAVKSGAPSGPIAAGFVGSWEAKVKLGKAWEDGDPLPDRAVRIRVTGGAEAATGIFVNVPDPKTEHAMSTIVEQNGKLAFEVRGAGGVFSDGEVHGRELSGMWSEFNSDPVPLTFVRVEP